jgi:PilZ domain
MTIVSKRSQDGDRIASRHVFERRIWIQLDRGSEKIAVQGWTRDLSESGLSAFVAQGPVFGELVTLEVPLSENRKDVIPAKVVRTLGTECGFQFTALSAEQRKRIQAVLREHSELPRRSR